MGEISEGSVDAQNAAKNLIELIVGEVMKTLNERTGCPFNFKNLTPQNFANEETLVCVIKQEGISLEEVKTKENSEPSSSICYQVLPEDCVHTSSLSLQGEGDFQTPYVREAKAFHDLEAEGMSRHDQTVASSPSSVATSFTDELIAQLHNDINNISFDNIHLSDSEVEKEIQTVESRCEEQKEQVDRNNRTSSFCNEFSTELSDPETCKLRGSPKFSDLNDVLNRYFRLKENTGEEIEIEEGQDSLSDRHYECYLASTNKEGSEDALSQTNPFKNPFLYPDVNSTIALTSVEIHDTPGRFSPKDPSENNEWVEANEVQIRITEPGCSKDLLKVEDDCAVQKRQYWSNVGVITEHMVDRRYMGPEQAPGIEMVTGMTRVQEKYLTEEPEKIIWASDPDKLEKKSLTSSHNSLKDQGANYLSLPKKSETRKKKTKFVSRLTHAVSSIFRLNKKDSKE